MKTYKTETDDIFFGGDLHGNFDLINPAINTYKLDNCNIVICGDIGIGFEKEEYYKQKFTHIQKALSKHNVHLYMFRGNHDDPSYFDGEHFMSFEFIHVIPDYSIIQTSNRNMLCVGGSISIDRMFRKQRMDIEIINYMKHHYCSFSEADKNARKLYWDNEAISYDEKELNEIEELGIKIDTVCTHTSPSFTKPLTKDNITQWLELDKNLEVDLDADRHACDLILEHLKKYNHPLENWYYAHFHFSNVEIIDGIKYKLLDMCRSHFDLEQ